LIAAKYEMTDRIAILLPRPTSKAMTSKRFPSCVPTKGTKVPTPDRSQGATRHSIEDAVRVELEAIAFRDGLKLK
jgi:hypothetical protein